jgi:hypothetical protein
MKVSCTRLLDYAGKHLDKSTWLTVGKIYHVLELIRDTDGVWKVRLVSDEPNGIAVFRLDQFEVVSPHLPHNWIVVWGKDGFFELTPEPWSRFGFWELYYEHDLEAVKLFDIEYKRILVCDP